MITGRSFGIVEEFVQQNPAYNLLELARESGPVLFLGRYQGPSSERSRDPGSPRLPRRRSPAAHRGPPCAQNFVRPELRAPRTSCAQNFVRPELRAPPPARERARPSSAATGASNAGIGTRTKSRNAPRGRALTHSSSLPTATEQRPRPDSPAQGGATHSPSRYRSRLQLRHRRSSCSSIN